MPVVTVTAIDSYVLKPRPHACVKTLLTIRCTGVSLPSLCIGVYTYVKVDTQVFRGPYLSLGYSYTHFTGPQIYLVSKRLNIMVGPFLQRSAPRQRN